MSSFKFTPTVTTILMLMVLFMFMPVPARSQDAYEEDDTCGSSSIMLTGSSIQRRDFSDDNDDWVSFFACAGRDYEINSTNLEANVDTRLELYEPACGRLLQVDDNGGGGLASSLVWQAPHSGVYHLRIQNLLGVPGKSTGYDLRMSGDTTSCAHLSMDQDITTEGESYQDVISLVDGSTLFAGAVNHSYQGTLSREGLLVKRDPQGNLVWSRRYQVGTDSQFMRVAEDASGNLYMVGFTNAGPMGTRHYWVLKTDEAGNRLWEIEIGDDDGGGSDAADLVVTDSAIFVLGSRWDLSAGDGRVLLVKINPTGTILSTHHYGETGHNSFGIAITQIADGGLVIAANDSETGNAWWAFKVNTSGVMQWSQRMGVNSGVARTSDLRPTSDGGVLVLGFFENPTKLPLLIKLSSAGVVGDKRIYFNINTEVAAPKMVPDGNGNWLISGSSDDIIPRRGWVMKVNASLQVLWVRTFSPTSNDHGLFSTLTVNPVGDILAAGYTYAVGASQEDSSAWFVAMDDTAQMGAACSLTLGAASSMSSNTLNFTLLSSFAQELTLPLATSSPTSAVSDMTGTESLHCFLSFVQPNEVSGFGAAEPLLLPDASTFTWDGDPASGATSYNLYRGDLSALPASYGACDASGLGSPAWTDPTVPATGEAWFYLVSGVNGQGEGSLGEDSSASKRANLTPCP